MTFRRNINLFLSLLCIINYLSAQDAILQNSGTFISYENKKLITVKSFELKVINKKGDKYAEISIPYSKLVRVSKIGASVADKNGKVINWLKSSDIKERSLIQDYSFYEDNYVKEFTLTHTDYPYTVSFTYQTEQTEFLHIQNWSPLYFKEVPVLNAILKLKIPKNYRIKYCQQMIDSFSVDSSKTDVNYYWKTHSTNDIETEIYSPDYDTYIPFVKIVPVNFKYDIDGSFDNWVNYGDWECKLLNGLEELAAAEQVKIDELIRGLSEKKDIVKKLYHYLQDATHYINISVDKGGMKPYPAKYVCANKYGDCKALTNYMKAMLRYVGIQSIYCDVDATQSSETESIRKIDLKFPSQQFNHVMLCVPLESDTIWLDCTSKGPFNYPGTFTQNHDVFLVENKRSHFTRTPPLTKEQVHCKRIIDVGVNLNGNIILSVKKILRGRDYELIAGIDRSNSEEIKQRLVRNYLIEGAYEMTDYRIIPSHRDSASIVFEYKAKADALARKYGDDHIFKVISTHIPDFKDPSRRKLPVQIDSPINNSDSLNYHFSELYGIESIPEDKIVKSPYGEYNVKYIRSGNDVTVLKSFYLMSVNVEQKQYADFYSFIKKIKEIETKSFIITKKKV